MNDPMRDGQLAQEILENEIYLKAVIGAKNRIKEEWSAEKDPTKRDSLWHDIQSIDRVTRELETIKGDGVMARTAHERQNKRKGNG